MRFQRGVGLHFSFHLRPHSRCGCARGWTEVFERFSRSIFRWSWLVLVPSTRVERYRPEIGTHVEVGVRIGLCREGFAKKAHSDPYDCYIAAEGNSLCPKCHFSFTNIGMFK